MLRIGKLLLQAFLPWETRLEKDNLKPKPRADWLRYAHPLRDRWIESALALVAN